MNFCISTKCIFMPYVARRLLKMGNMIVDIKPCKENRDKTIFVFEDTEKLQSDLVLAVSHDIKMIELTEEEMKKYIKEDKLMASKINRKYSCDVKGIINVEDGIITVEVEDVDEPIILADFINDFVGKPNVKISVGYGEEL